MNELSFTVSFVGKADLNEELPHLLRLVSAGDTEGL
jgi:hypothetical protein